MDKRAWAVVGAAYGDEGKGLAVDALAHHLGQRGRRVLVARANGGAQAGHTVVCPTGGRHVFHHIGAGTFAGADTHLTRFFALHPTAFVAEAEALAGRIPAVAITADPRAPVTTPWDMLINQIVETHRAGNRHGSCGLGFGETLERTEKGPGLYAADLARADLRERLRAIQFDWLPARLAALGIDSIPDPFASFLEDERINLAFEASVAVFLRNIALKSDGEALGEADALIFEGAQGLELDQDFGEFPHVTRSNTGLRNPAGLVLEAGLTGLDVLYMTRTYTTRHGAGPLAREMTALEDIEVRDPTNAENPWQGRLRLAPLDTDRLSRAISWDRADVASLGLDIDAGLGVSHLDCIGPQATVWAQGREIRPGLPGFVGAISEAVGLPVDATGLGPTRESWRWLPEPAPARHRR